MTLARPFLFQMDPAIMRAEKTAIRNAQFEDKRIVLSRTRLDDLLPGDHERDLVEPDATPVGSVEFCQALLSRRGAPVNRFCSTYPPVLTPYLGRHVKQGVYRDVPEGWFVKPRYGVKGFTGHIKGEPWPDGERVPDRLPLVPVFYAPPVVFVVEARCYVLHGHVRGIARYIEPDDGSGPDPDTRVIDEMVTAFEDQNDVEAYALDVGVLDTGETVLVEWNDGWALGYYPDPSFTPAAYADLIEARWRQLIDADDR